MDYDSLVKTGTVTCDASSLAVINVNLGFVPGSVRIRNRSNGNVGWWNSSMPSGSINKITYTANGLVPAPTLSMHATNKANVKITACTVYVAGVPVAVALTEIAPSANTLTKAKYGVFGFECGANGTVDKTPNSATFAHDTSALAIANINATATGHVRLGYVVVLSDSTVSFIGATSTFDSANVVAYFVSENRLDYVTTGGITPLTGTASYTISLGTTGSGVTGFSIGTDAHFQVLSDVIEYAAWR